jgi:hypothetical protein
MSEFFTVAMVRGALPAASPAAQTTANEIAVSTDFFIPSSRECSVEYLENKLSTAG